MWLNCMLLPCPGGHVWRVVRDMAPESVSGEVLAERERCSGIGLKIC